MWQSKMDEIRQHHRGSTNQMEALFKFYIRYHYAPSWQDITSALQRMGQDDVADVITTKYVRGRLLYVYHGHSEFASISNSVSCSGLEVFVCIGFF